MKTEPNIADICNECDYAPAFCDGDVATCINAVNFGANSEIGRESGGFDRKCLNKEFEI